VAIADEEDGLEEQVTLVEQKELEEDIELAEIVYCSSKMMKLLNEALIN
jgi:hypothetical protein